MSEAVHRADTACFYCKHFSQSLSKRHAVVGVVHHHVVALGVVGKQDSESCIVGKLRSEATAHTTRACRSFVVDVGNRDIKTVYVCPNIAVSPDR